MQRQSGPVFHIFHTPFILFDFSQEAEQMKTGERGYALYLLKDDRLSLSATGGSSKRSNKDSPS